MTISYSVRTTAAEMLDELDANRLSVVLVPDWFGSRHRRLRFVDGENPRWYQEFCRSFPANRYRPRQRSRSDTAIKRRHTLRGLGELARGVCGSVYARRLLPFVEEEAVQRAVEPEWSFPGEVRPMNIKILEFIG